MGLRDWFPNVADAVDIVTGYSAAANAKRGPNGGVILDPNDKAYGTAAPTAHPYQSGPPGINDGYFGSPADPNAAGEDAGGFLPGTGPTGGELLGGAGASGFKLPTLSKLSTSEKWILAGGAVLAAALLAHEIRRL